MADERIIISASPHVHSDRTSKKLMYDVLIALIPAFLVTLYVFGISALIMTTVAVISCILFEYLIQKYLLKTTVTVGDGSALITGILLAFNLPSSLPLWMVIIGSFVAIGIAKMSFGGLGYNIFNPALVGRVFLFISFPAQMSSWPVPVENNMTLVDAISGETTLGIIKEGLMYGETMSTLTQQIPNITELLLGITSGSAGEMSALALILGGVYLLAKKSYYLAHTHYNSGNYGCIYRNFLVSESGTICQSFDTYSLRRSSSWGLLYGDRSGDKPDDKKRYGHLRYGYCGYYGCD